MPTFFVISASRDFAETSWRPRRHAVWRDPEGTLKFNEVLNW